MTTTDDSMTMVLPPQRQQTPTRRSEQSHVNFPDATPVHRFENVEDLTAEFDDSEPEDVVEKKHMFARANTVPAELIAEVLEAIETEQEEPTLRDRHPSAPDWLDEGDMATVSTEVYLHKMPATGDAEVALMTASISSFDSADCLQASFTSGTGVRNPPA
jgi:hypothetical protein